jgi:hypothetical protein
LVVISLLLVAAVCSSSFFAFALKVYRSPVSCGITGTGQTSEGKTETFQTCCYTETTTYNNGKSVEKDYCQDCVKYDGGDYVCGSWYTPRTSAGTTNLLPPSAGVAQPSSTPPPISNAHPPPSSALPSPLKQQSTTPITKEHTKAFSLVGNNTSVLTRGHHHKGSTGS